MIRPRYPLLVLAGLLLVLTYLLVPLATPDVGRHERMSNALQALILHEAALQRDVLKARAGLLGNYDPLVHSLENLRHAFDTLDDHVADSNARTKIGQHLDGMAAVLGRSPVNRRATSAGVLCDTRSGSVVAELKCDMSQKDGFASGLIAPSAGTRASAWSRRGHP